MVRRPVGHAAFPAGPSALVATIPRGSTTVTYASEPPRLHLVTQSLLKNMSTRKASQALGKEHLSVAKNPNRSRISSEIYGTGTGKVLAMATWQGNTGVLATLAGSLAQLLTLVPTIQDPLAIFPAVNRQVRSVVWVTEAATAMAT